MRQMVESAKEPRTRGLVLTTGSPDFVRLLYDALPAEANTGFKEEVFV